MCSNAFEQVFPERPLVSGHGLEDAVQCADSKRRVRWYYDPVMAGGFGLENDVAADLMDESIPPRPVQVAGEARAGQVAGQFHARLRRE